MNILVVPPNDLLRHPIPNRLFHLFSRLADRHTVNLLAYPGHPLAKQSKMRDASIREITFKPIPSRNLSLYYFLNYGMMHSSLERFIDEMDIVVHANILPSRIVTSMCSKKSIPSIYDYVDHFPESAASYYKSSLMNHLVIAFVTKITKENFSRSTAGVTPTHGLKAILEKLNDTKPIFVIPNGFDESKFKPYPRQQARDRLGLSSKDRLVLFFGSWDTWFDQEAMLRLTRTTSCKLVVTGTSHSSNARRSLDSLRARTKNLIFLGNISDDLVPIVVNSCDLVFAPYRMMTKNLAVPVKILESLGCAVPVVTTAIPEFRRWFGDLLLYYRSEGEAEDAIRKAFANNDELKSQIASHREQLVNQFSWSNLANDYEAKLKQITNH